MKKSQLKALIKEVVSETRRQRDVVRHDWFKTFAYFESLEIPGLSTADNEVEITANFEYDFDPGQKWTRDSPEFPPSVDMLDSEPIKVDVFGDGGRLVVSKKFDELNGEQQKIIGEALVYFMKDKIGKQHLEDTFWDMRNSASQRYDPEG